MLLGRWPSSRPGTRGFFQTGSGTPQAPPSLPLVTALGVYGQTTTGITIYGSVNPQGLAGTWWFVYGLTPQFGSQTTPQAISATSIPANVVAALSGLIPTDTYYFALVAQTAAGTVTSAPLTFVMEVPQPPVDINNLPTPTAQPPVSIPHWQFPIRFEAQGPGGSPGGVIAVEQDSLEEVFSDVQFVAVCQKGACPELPTFGISDPTFGQEPLDPSRIVAEIQQWEPRATFDTVSQAIPTSGPLGDPNAGNWQIGLTTKLSGSGS